MPGKAGHRGWGWVQKLPSKRYRASYVHGMTRYAASTTFSARMYAEAWLAEERRLIERGEWSAPAVRAATQQARGITVAEYLERWIAQRASISDGTRYAYENNVRVHIKPKPLGRIPLSALTPEAVRVWNPSMDPSKPTARAACYSMLRTAMNTATLDRIFDRNPAIIPGASTQSTKRQAVLLTMAEVAALADGITERLRAWALVAALCGLRFGEATELRRSDISDDCSMLTVSRACRHVGGKCIIKSTKTGDTRHVIVPTHIRADLKHHLDVFVGKSADALVFAPVLTGHKRACEHLPDDTVRKELVAPLKAIGKPDMVIHDLRHTQLLIREAVILLTTLTGSPSVSAENTPGLTIVYWSRRTLMGVSLSRSTQMVASLAVKAPTC